MDCKINGKLINEDINEDKPWYVLSFFYTYINIFIAVYYYYVFIELKIYTFYIYKYYTHLY